MEIIQYQRYISNKNTRTYNIFNYFFIHIDTNNLNFKYKKIITLAMDFLGSALIIYFVMHY